MPINLGSGAITAAKIGSTDVSKIMLGSAEVYSAAAGPLSVSSSTGGTFTGFTESGGSADAISGTIQSPEPGDANVYLTVNEGGTLYADVSVSTESGVDYVYMYVNSVQSFRLSGNVNNYTKEVSVAAGDTVRLRYTRDSSDGGGTDTFTINSLYVGQSVTTGITPNTDGSARFYLPAATTAFQVGAATTTGYYRITDGTTASAVTGASYYAATSQYWYAYYLNASLSGMSSAGPKTIELYSCDAAGNKSGSLVFVNLAANNTAVDAVDLSGLALIGASAFTSTAYGSPPFKYTMSGGSSVLPSSITEIRAVGTTFGSFVQSVSSYYYAQGLDIVGQQLDAAQLDQLYADLATVAAGTLVVRSNPGTPNDTPSIASAKGYTVYGT